MVFSLETARELSPLFNGKKGKILYEVFTRLTGLDNVNEIHRNVEARGIAPGPDFAKGILDQMELDFLVGNPERLAFPEGPFITISNHVYGHIDGICLVDLVGHVRADVKVLVNEVLMYIQGLAPNFISVNPTLKERQTTQTSIQGIKLSLQQLRNGGPLCLFPSGAVADLKPSQGWKLVERDWQDAAVKLIRKARVPVVPIRFFDRNSNFYYSLGLIDYRVRLLRLCHEVYNKKGTFPRVGIGETISVEEQNAVSDADFKAFLRSRVDQMPLPEHFVKRSTLWK